MREFVIQSPKPENNAGSRPKPRAPLPSPPSSRRRYQTPAIVAKQASRPAKDLKPAAKSSTESPPPRKRHGEKIFVVSYEGSFVGFFEAAAELTPREAFLRVASDMAARDPDFEPERLEIYKPVLIKSARPADGLQRLRGRLRCFRPRKRR